VSDEIIHLIIRITGDWAYELVIRIALDEHRDERQEVDTRIGRVLAIREQAQYLLAGPPNAVGEVVYTCAVPADTISWLVDQLDPRGDALVAAVAIADQFVLTLPLSYGGHHPEMAGVSIGEHGQMPDMTVGSGSAGHADRRAARGAIRPVHLSAEHR
jgi:hypothetical protein